MKKRIGMFLAAAMAAMCAQADTWTDPDTGYTWTYPYCGNGDTAEIGNGYSCAISPTPTGAVAIPSTLGGKTVTSIRDQAFYCCSGLTSVTIPDGVTSIGRLAFYHCSGLTNVTIPDSVTSIGEYAFNGCKGLTSVAIPGRVTSIGRGAFSDCSGLKSFVVASGNPSYKVVSGLLLTKDGKTLVSVPGGLSSVTIPASVTSIGDCAFAGCSGLASVTIPDGVTSIGSSAFSGCSGLASVTIPDGVTSIGDSAFNGCSGLASVTIPDGVTSIGSYAFCNCSGLASVTIPDGVTSIGSYAFCNCSGLTSVTIPNSVTSIGDFAFSGCSGLTSVTIPDSVTNIGSSAFSGCSGLKNVTIPQVLCSSKLSDNLPSYRDLTNVVIGAKVTRLADYLFQDCMALKSVYFKGDAPDTGVSIYFGTPRSLVTYVVSGTIGWSGGISEDVPEVWNERAIAVFRETGAQSSLIVKPNDKKGGTVTGGGTYEVGKKTTLKATANNGYVFAGWFTDKACTKPLNPKGYDNRNATVKVAMPENDTTIYAKFVSKGDDKAALKFTSATKKLATTPAKATAGSKFSLKIGASSLSLPTFSATGLPKGLSINKATGEISGVGTVPGAYTAKVTITSAAGNKITQNVKITVNAPSWAKGTFYGTAKPGKKGDPMAYLQFTVGTTGKVSGKVTYKGKAYSFTSTLSSCTASKATFTPSMKIGKATFKPGAVTIRETENAGGWLVEAANKKGTFTGQKKANLVKKGKALAKLVGKSFTFTKKTKNSGLTKSGDKLKVKLADGDKVTASGTINGKKLAALSAPLIVSEVSALDGMTTYTLYADILDAKTKYYKTVVFTVKVPVVLKPVPKVSAAFAK